jgi:hypothetical protein
MKNKFLSCLILVSALFLGGCSEDPIEESAFGILTGKVVTKGDNIPLPNVKVTTTPASNTIFTDAEGNFIFEEIEAGDYSVQAELTEFLTSFEGANVISGKTSTVVLELDSVNAANILPFSPVLLFPEDGTENIGTETELIWSSSENDDDDILYTLELRNGETNEIQTFKDLIDTTLVIQDLPIGKNFIWQVSADDGLNTPAESALSSFATKDGALNRFFFVRNIEGNNVIFSGTEPDSNEEETVGQNELQLTGTDKNSYRPRKNNTTNKIAFLRSLGGATQLFTMNIDGTELNQVTNTVPVAGFRQSELEYSWFDNGAKIYYPNFNKLYSINQDGSGNQLVYQAANTVLISEVAVNPTNELIAIKTNGADGYGARIIVVDLVSGAEEIVIENQPGALGGLDFSIDGNRVLYTRDMSGIENIEYRQLDSHIFEYDLTTDTATEVLTSKIPGTNDLDAKYSPDDGSIIFMNTSNDGISERKIYRTNQNDEITGETESALLFTNAFMPNWE